MEGGTGKGERGEDRGGKGKRKGEGKGRREGKRRGDGKSKGRGEGKGKGKGGGRRREEEGEKIMRKGEKEGADKNGLEPSRHIM